MRRSSFSLETKSQTDCIVNRAVFVASALISLLLIVFSMVYPDRLSHLFTHLLRWVSDAFGWYCMLLVAVYAVFVLYVGFSRYGDIKLG